MERKTKVQWSMNCGQCVNDGNVSHADDVHAYPKQKVFGSWIA